MRNRLPSLVDQIRLAFEQRNAIAVDPLLKVRDAALLLGNPSYATICSWIKAGALHCHRVGRGHHKVRLSEIRRFLSAHEVKIV